MRVISATESDFDHRSRVVSNEYHMTAMALRVTYHQLFGMGKIGFMHKGGFNVP